MKNRGSSSLCHILLFTYPCPFVPYALQWALAVFAEPPFAKFGLDGKCRESNQQAYGVSAILRKVQAYWEIYYCSNDGLRYVVGEAHLAVVSQYVHSLVKTIVLVQEYER